MKKKIEWIKTRYVGVRYFKHSNRKHGVQFDKSFHIRFNGGGKLYQSSLGWASEGMTAEKASLKLSEYKRNFKAGKRPWTLTMEKEDADRKAQAKVEANATLERESMTFGEYFEKTYYPIAMTSKKQRSYEQELSHFNLWLNPVIGDMKLQDVRPIHLERVKRNLLNAPAISRKKNPVKTKEKQARSPRMIQYVFATGRQCWNYARRDGIVKGEWPGKEVKIPKVENQRMRFLTDTEGDQLLAGLKKRSQQLHDICLLSLDSGLRAYEVFSLAWNRVDLDQKSVKVFDSKGKDRVVYLTDRAVNMFQRMPKNKGLVFKSRTGGQIKEISNAFNREVDNLGWNEGVKSRKDKLVFHSLRHSYASRLVARGVDLYVVGQLMGHSDLTMTKRYSHLRPDTLKAAVKTLEQPTADVIPLKANGNK